MTLIKDLKASRDVFEKCGGHKRSLARIDPDGHVHSVCAVGAINIACGGYYDPFAVSLKENRRLEVIEALKKHLPSEFAEVFTYNDASTVTKQDVLNVFDKAIADIGGMCE